MYFISYPLKYRLYTPYTILLGQMLQGVVNTHRIQGFVVGFPLFPTDIEDTPPLCRFITKLVKLTPVKGYDLSLAPHEICVSFWDERESTKDARVLARKLKLNVKNTKDSLSACVILKGWLEGVGGG
ncbi:pre-16S rRNA-processing nuclease YqgF [archaeon]|nr:MAG: pre-16S rRNA-processing nuclease YqgF [archaeon]